MADTEDDHVQPAELSSDALNDPTCPQLRPDSSAISVTPDGGVLKTVLQAGSDRRPNLHARCLVHYVGWLADTGSMFHNTKKETNNATPAKLVAGRDVVKTEVGINLAVATMAQGERALVYIEDPKYGWGEKGNFSFPSIPPNAKLVYEVELVDFDDVAEDKEGGMLYEEKLEAAERRRKAGNELFKEGKYKEALVKYAVALSYMDEDFLMQLDGFYLDRAMAVMDPIHLNMALCQLKTGDYNTCIYNCGKVLENDPHNVKALYRRACARHLLGRTEEALNDLEEAQSRDPNDAAITKELAAVKRSIKEERKAEAALFKGQFKAPKPSTAAAGAADGASAAGQADEGGSPPVARAASQGGALAVLQALLVWLVGLLRMLLGMPQQVPAAANQQ